MWRRLKICCCFLWYIAVLEESSEYRYRYPLTPMHTHTRIPPEEMVSNLATRDRLANHPHGKLLTSRADFHNIVRARSLSLSFSLSLFLSLSFSFSCFLSIYLPFSLSCFAPLYLSFSFSFSLSLFLSLSLYRSFFLARPLALPFSLPLSLSFSLARSLFLSHSLYLALFLSPACSPFLSPSISPFLSPSISLKIFSSFRLTHLDVPLFPRPVSLFCKLLLTWFAFSLSKRLIMK